MSLEDRIELFCRERETNAHGQLVVSDEGTTLRLFSFDGFFLIESGSNIVLDLSDAGVATLLDCIMLEGAGTASSMLSGKRVDFETVTPNLTLIGHHEWSNEKLVYRSSFMFDDCAGALRDRDLVQTRYEDGETENSFGRTIIEIDHDRPPLLSAQTKDLIVDISVLSEDRVRQRPYVQVEFLDGVSINRYLGTLEDIVTFFALAGGYVARPYRIKVSYLSRQLQEKEVKERHDRHSFDARYRWPEFSKPSHLVGPHTSAVHTLDSVERSACQASLTSWLERREHWWPSYRFAMSVLWRQGVMDRDRLLAAFGWFETIPNTSGTAELCPEKIDRIVAAALKELTTLGLEKHEKRVKGLLGQLCNESLARQLERTIQRLRASYGEQLVSKTLERDCANAVKLRGRAAHRNRGWENIGLQELANAIQAVELVSFLMMFEGIPLASTAKKRLTSNPFVFGYAWNPRKNLD